MSLEECSFERKLALLGGHLPEKLIVAIARGGHAGWLEDKREEVSFFGHMVENFCTF